MEGLNVSYANCTKKSGVLGMLGRSTKFNKIPRPNGDCVNANNCQYNSDILDLTGCQVQCEVSFFEWTVLQLISSRHAKNVKDLQHHLRLIAIFRAIFSQNGESVRGMKRCKKHSFDAFDAKHNKHVWLLLQLLLFTMWWHCVSFALCICVNFTLPPFFQHFFSISHAHYHRSVEYYKFSFTTVDQKNFAHCTLICVSEATKYSRECSSHISERAFERTSHSNMCIS